MPEDEPLWLQQRRQEFNKKFSEMPNPTPKDEEWRYTNLKIDFVNLVLQENASMKMEIKNGNASELRKLISERNVENFFEKINLDLNDKVVNFVESKWSNGVFAELENNGKLEIKFFSEENAATKSLIIVKPNAKVEIFEYLENSAEFFANNTEIIAGENSEIDYFIFQNFSRADNFVLKRAMLGRNARINWHFGYFGGNLSRLKIETVFAGEGSSSENYGIFAGNEGQHFDITTLAHHKVPHTSNNILTKGVLKGKSTSVYRGLIKIEKEAQKTDSYLGDHTLLLSEKSLANSIPSLKIDANDVRATHGATVGQVDKEQMFYLMSKGIDEKDAEMLLVEGFLEQVAAKIKNNNFKSLVETRVREKILNES